MGRAEASHNSPGPADTVANHDDVAPRAMPNQKARADTNVLFMDEAP